MEKFIITMKSKVSFEADKESVERIKKTRAILVDLSENGEPTGISLNKAFIQSIEPNKEQIQFKPFRPVEIKKEQDFKSLKECMADTWRILKEGGLFREFNSYEEWEKIKSAT